MKQFKNEKEVRDFFGSTTLKFHFMCDGVAEFKTVRQMLVNHQYKDFKVSLFPDDNPFGAYDSLDDLLSVCQIFEVEDLETGIILYHQKYIDYKNN